VVETGAREKPACVIEKLPKACCVYPTCPPLPLPCIPFYRERGPGSLAWLHVRFCWE